MQGKRLIAQLHRSRYGENLLQEVPSAHELEGTARSFFGLTMRSSSRFSAQDLITATAAAAAVTEAHSAAGAAKERTPEAA